ncbi:MAG: YqaE/Pmp3 family membrane protein [Cytophagaceae bacterium]
MRKSITKIAMALVAIVLVTSCGKKELYFFSYHPETIKKKQANESPVNFSNEELSASVEKETNVKYQNVTDLLDDNTNVNNILPNVNNSNHKVESPEVHNSEPVSLSKKEVRKAIKELKKEKSVNKEDRADTNTLLLVIIAILLPPLAVALVDGITGPFWLSLILTLLFYVPGLIYALYRVLRA